MPWRTSFPIPRPCSTPPVGDAQRRHSPASCPGAHLTTRGWNTRLTHRGRRRSCGSCGRPAKTVMDSEPSGGGRALARRAARSRRRSRWPRPTLTPPAGRCWCATVRAIGDGRRAWTRSASRSSLPGRPTGYRCRPVRRSASSTDRPADDAGLKPPPRVGYEISRPLLGSPLGTAPASPRSCRWSSPAEAAVLDVCALQSEAGGHRRRLDLGTVLGRRVHAKRTGREISGACIAVCQRARSCRSIANGTSRSTAILWSIMKRRASSVRSMSGLTATPDTA